MDAVNCIVEMLDGYRQGGEAGLISSALGMGLKEAAGGSCANARRIARAVADAERQGQRRESDPAVDDGLCGLSEGSPGLTSEGVGFTRRGQRVRCVIGG